LKIGSFFGAYTTVDRQFPIYPRYRTIARILDLVNERQEMTRAEVIHLINVIDNADRNSPESSDELLKTVREELAELLETSASPIPYENVIKLKKANPGRHH